MSRIGNQATAGRRPAATPILTREIHGYGLYRYISFRDVFNYFPANGGFNLWFVGRLVTVKYLTLKRYHQRFPVALEATERLNPSGSSPSSLVTFDPDEAEDEEDINDSDIEAYWTLVSCHPRQFTLVKSVA